MAKVAFSKLALKKQDDVKIVKIGNVDIEVKQYLPVNDKLDLITRVISEAQDINNFINPVKIEVISSIEILVFYTNLTFTDKQKDDIAKLYDLLSGNNIFDIIFNAIPEEELNFILNSINETVNSIYTYKNSALGILETISTDYSNLQLDASAIQGELANADNLKLLKDVLTKLG